jgi:hypothetical protein
MLQVPRYVQTAKARMNQRKDVVYVIILGAGIHIFDLALMVIRKKDVLGSSSP